MFINIHTHLPHKNGTWSIQNLFKDFDSIGSLFYYSVGIHPWHIDENTIATELAKVKMASELKNVLAIGECGLDRVCKTPYKLQEKIFIEQLLWANEIAKPLIIHCVRAHREILFLLKEYNNLAPVIFHGFNNNEEIANSIIEAGCMISFGKSLMYPNSENVFSKIPIENIFLETDDNEIIIDDIYKQAAKIKNISTERLSLQIQKNRNKVFNNIAL